MRNRYELLSSDSDSPKTPSPKSPLESDDTSWSGWSSPRRSSSSSSSSDQERKRKKHLKLSVEKQRNAEQDLLNSLDRCKWLTIEGEPIDYNVLKKYLKQVEESEGFNVTDFPGVISGITSVIPNQSLIDNREQRHEEYDVIMDLATLATKTYNEKHQTEFKVVEIEKLGLLNVGMDEICYITFSAIDVSASNYHKGSLRYSLYNQLVKIMRGAQLIWAMMLLWLYELLLFPDMCDSTMEKLEKKVLKLQSAPELRAGRDDLLDKTSPRQIFQAVVVKEYIREVKLCRVAK